MKPLAMLIYAVFALQAVGLVGCTSQRCLQAELQPKTLHATNLEETLGRRDELMLAYSLTAYDAANKAVSVVNGGWGVDAVQQGQTLTLQPKAQPISLTIPKRGRIVASVVLIEVDNYTRASEILSRVQKIHNVVSIPIGLLVSATEILTPLKYVTAGLMAAGLGVQLVDHFDTDDVLGQSSTEIREGDQKRSGKQVLHIPSRFSGRHLLDTFSYELNYDVALKTVKLSKGKQPF